ncbi:MAG TPA: NAD(P)-dependent oxidoreductase [Actinopolymorphaceae bacterium]|nr:NAD(P)-dependent oxidoreductase [Actinopolymorphaceae bacterium]
MRIAVTGGNGRLGRSVVAAATAGGHEVVAFDRVLDEPKRILPGYLAEPPVAVTPLDVTDYTALQSGLDGCDALVHLAAFPSPHGAPPHVIHDNNVQGTYHALMAAAEVGIRRVVCASSVNAIGGIYSRTPRYDYVPVDEDHPTYAEDAYSLSKWLGEQQGDAVARLYPDMTIASLRFHWITPERPPTQAGDQGRLDAHAKHLWGWVDLGEAARACLLGLTADYRGHEAFFIVAPTTTSDLSSAELRRRYHPDVPLRRELEGNAGFFDCAKAAKLLGWVHDV